MPKGSPCFKVPRIEGQKIIFLADKFELRDRALEVQQQTDSICVPLRRMPTEKELEMIRREVLSVQVEVCFFIERTKQGKTLDGVLAGSLPQHLLDSLPKAFDIVGDIAIVEVPKELKSYEKLIGNAILETHRNVKTVLAKAGAVSGMYRVRDYAVLAGEQRTCTIHKEYGCVYEVDVAKAYFSPRLSHEHDRVASLVREGEIVVDLFAGVGPFSVLIGNRHPTVRVYALDLNPDAYELLKKNARLNRVESNVTPILGDARQIVHDRLAGIADRVIMNLPESASEFVDVACEALKREGGVVHFYGFVRQPDSVAAMKSRFAEKIEKVERSVERFLLVRAVRETAPYQQQVVLDVHVV